MNGTASKDWAAIIAERLGCDMAAERVYLFGSRARGGGDDQSDWDFLVVVPATTENRYQRAVRAREALQDIRIPMDLIVLTREEWMAEKRVVTSLASMVEREGLLLHG